MAENQTREWTNSFAWDENTWLNPTTTKQASSSGQTMEGTTGSDELTSYFSGVRMNGNDGNDIISALGSNSTLSGGKGLDRLFSYGDNAYLDGGDGDDMIMSYGKAATIRGGSGNDLMIISGDGTMADAGAGNDMIVLSATPGTYSGDTNVTVSGGAGSNFFLINGNSNKLYLTIGDAKGEDWWSLENTASLTYSVIGGNLVLKDVKNNYTITLKGISDLSKVAGLTVQLVKYGQESVTGVEEEYEVTSVTTLGALLNYQDASGSGTDTTGGGTGDDTVPGNTLPSGLTLSATKTTLTIKSPFTGTLNAADYATTIKTIDASSATGKVNITANSLANTIKASKGGGTLTGGKGNDTITGGAGKDTFAYATGDGNDVIKSFSTSDLINVTKGTVSKAAISGKNVKLTVGSGSMTLEKASTLKKIAVKTTSGQYTMNLSNSKTFTVTLDKTYKGTFDAKNFFTNKAVNIDASKATKAVSITGNAKANTIKAGKAGGTLTGGKGNDTLTLGAGKDTISYTNGDGKDTIKNYTSGKDVIKLGKSTKIKSVTVKGNDVRLNIGSGYMNLIGAKGKKLTIIDANGKKATKTYKKSTSKPMATAANFVTEDTASFVATSGVLTETSALLADTAVITDSSGTTALLSDASSNIIGADAIGDIYGTTPTGDFSMGFTGSDLVDDSNLSVRMPATNETKKASIYLVTPSKGR